MANNKNSGLGLLLAIISIIVAVANPETRVWLGLDKPKEVKERKDRNTEREEQELENLTHEKEKITREIEKLRKEQRAEKKRLEEEKKRFAEIQREEVEKQKQDSIIQSQKQREEQKEAEAKIIQRLIDDMIFVEGGTFEMGCTKEQGTCSDDEKPPHIVTVSSFNIGKYEVTNEQFCAFLNAKGNQEEGGEKWLRIDDAYCNIEQRNGRYTPKIGYARHPVVEVTWYGSKSFCKWMRQTTSKTFRLPTEAEWEYAARGGNRSRNYKYAGSNDIGSVAWYEKNSFNVIHPVGTRNPNELRLYDMTGNVSEVCSDWYDENYYKNSPRNNPKGPSSPQIDRVYRGGSYRSPKSISSVSDRFSTRPDSNDNRGFRLAQTP